MDIKPGDYIQHREEERIGKVISVTFFETIKAYGIKIQWANPSLFTRGIRVSEPLSYGYFLIDPVKDPVFDPIDLEMGEKAFLFEERIFVEFKIGMK